MNDAFRFDPHAGELMCEQVPASSLAARFGTPLYVYSANAFRNQYRAVAKAFAEVNPLVCFAVKACSTLAILDLLRHEGAGFDCVSKGEILRCLRVGADPKKIVFAGVGKTQEEIEFALDQRILMFNVESENELRLIAECAKRIGTTAGIALRVNPDVDPKTHAYITTGKRENKFGIDFARARACVDMIRATDSLQLKGIHCHLGSQINDDGPHSLAAQKLAAFITEIASSRSPLSFIDLGGGFGISYKGDEGLDITAFAKKIVPIVKPTGLRMIVEPGRYISGNSGILLTRLTYLKQSGDKAFAIVDAAMNDLLRPSIYDAWHRIWPTAQAVRDLSDKEGQVVDVVGPVCESGDFLGKDRRLPKLSEGELIAVYSAGAYGFSMASNYNTRPRAAEVMVDGSVVKEIRVRESYEDMFKNEVGAL